MTSSDGHLPGETRVGRVRLRVGDLDRVATFYETVVGLHRQHATAERVTLGAGGDPLLELEAAPEAPERPSDAAGLFHVAVRLPSRAALAGALARVEAEWDLDGASDHHVSEALYLSDPEGNGVELYRDRPRAEWPATEDGRVAMDTLPLDRDALRAAGEHTSRVPTAATVGHVHLEVTSLEAARAFYADRLGLRLRQEFGASALFLAAGDYHHHVGLNTWNRRTAPASGRGLAWFELVLPDGESLAAARERVAADRLSATDADDGVAVADPDGIEVRLRAE